MNQTEEIKLNQITIRGIPAEIEKLIKKEAQKKGISLNKAFVSLIKKTTGVKDQPQKKTPRHDLDRFFGIWAKGEASSFDDSLELQRRIDDDLWK